MGREEGTHEIALGHEFLSTTGSDADEPRRGLGAVTTAESTGGVEEAFWLPRSFPKTLTTATTSRRGPFRVAVVLLVLGSVLAGCGTPYSGLEVGDCVTGNVSIEGAFRQGDCADLESLAGTYRVVVAKYEDDGAIFNDCPGTYSEPITDGTWVLCFEPHRGRG